jgi:hypothetical protein
MGAGIKREVTSSNQGIGTNDQLLLRWWGEQG